MLHRHQRPPALEGDGEATAVITFRSVYSARAGHYQNVSETAEYGTAEKAPASGKHEAERPSTFSSRNQDPDV